MLFHVIPQFCANAGLNRKFVSLESVEIKELGLLLTSGVEVMARHPYHNKNYSVVCRKKGTKAVEGILVDIGDLREVTVRTKWNYFFTTVVHEVIYVIAGEDLGFATANPMRQVFSSHPIEIVESIKVQCYELPTMTFKDEPYFEREGKCVIIKDTSHTIKFLKSLVAVPTLTIEDFYNHRFMGNYRLPKLEDVFSKVDKGLK